MIPNLGYYHMFRNNAVMSNEQFDGETAPAARRSYVKPEITVMDDVADVVQANPGSGNTDSGTPPNAYS